MKKLQKTILTFLTLTAALAGSVKAQTSITTGLVAYYPMNGNANDASGNGNNGTVLGATLATNRFGVTNCAYFFNGSAKIIAPGAGLPSGRTNRTVSAWFLAQGLNQDIVTLGDAFVADHRFSMLYGYSSVANNLSFVGSFDDYVVNLGHTLIGAGWQHFVITYNNDTNQGAGVLYLNGTQIGSFLKTNLNIDGTKPLVIGSSATNADNENFTGLIDDVRIYNRTLSSNEVSDLYKYESGAQPTVALKPAVYLTSSTLLSGVNYQLQTSPDLSIWTDYGAPFTVTSNVYNSAAYWPTTGTNQLFLRLQVVRP